MHTAIGVLREKLYIKFENLQQFSRNDLWRPMVGDVPMFYPCGLSSRLIEPQRLWCREEEKVLTISKQCQLVACRSSSHLALMKIGTLKMHWSVIVLPN